MKFLLTIFAAAFAGVYGGNIAPGLMAKVRVGEVTEAILELPQVVNQLNTNAGVQSLIGDAKAAAVTLTLQDLTSSAQAPFLSAAKSLGLQTQHFWASNVILVRGLTTRSLEALAATNGDFVLREQQTVSVNAAVKNHSIAISGTSQWNIDKIRAPAAWGVTQGKGCIAIVVDTGANLDHTALKDGFGGVWLDPYYNTPLPTDEHGHGSHVTGTIAGRENGVGVAPAAQWISCRGLDHTGSGTEAALLACAEFAITVNPRPRVSSNSWGTIFGGLPFYDSAISAMKAAGIIPVFAVGAEMVSSKRHPLIVSLFLGNWGPSCGSAGSPGDRPDVISVGATTSDDSLAYFSSRGPSITGLLKPELSAPGQGILSTGTKLGDYVTMSGTSMATPHVAGAVCLLLSANPGWGFDEVFDALTSTAAHPPLSDADRACGLPTPGTDYPNYGYGWGRIDIGAALGV